MRKVTCQATKEKGNPEDFFQAPNGKYFKNEDIYNEYTEEMKAQKKFIAIVNKNILKIPYGSKNGLIGKKISESGMRYKDALVTLEEKYDEIKKYLDDKKDFSDASKILIIMNYVANENKMHTTYTGCYCIENKQTHAIYIGESIDIFSRFTQHISDLYKGTHHCEKLQKAFNETHDISNFSFKPLHLLQIVSKDKKEEKEETLYLESAYFLKAENENVDIYNTVNPYLSLKYDFVKYRGEKVNSKSVLKKIYDDKYEILTGKLKKKVQKDLEDFLQLDKHDTNKENKKDSNLIDNLTSESTNNNLRIYSKDEVPLPNYNITEILNDSVWDWTLPEKYDYSKVRKALSENNIIYIDENNYTVATDESLENHLYYLISDKIDKNGIRKRRYRISEEGKNKIKEILSKYGEAYFLQENH